jgi:cobalt-zinc-cadmium efflux system outer membrane protein
LQLKTLIGADVAETVKLAPQNERPPRLDLGLSELTDIALRERADLQAARLGEQIGSARINLARSNAIPNITGSVRYSKNKGIVDLPATAGGGFANDLDNEITFGMSIDIPIFNRNQGEIASATGEQLQATRNREFLESTIKRDVAIAYRKYRAAAETLVIYSTQIIPRSEENLRAVQSAYGFGEFSIFDVVNEQRRLIENITNYNQSLRDYYNALNELETALGVTIPPTGLTPVSSILPSEDLAPSQANREKLLKSIEKVEIPKKIEISKNKKQEEEKE